MENKQDIVEKRIKPGIIRRRAQKTVEETAPKEEPAVETTAKATRAAKAKAAEGVPEKKKTGRAKKSAKALAEEAPAPEAAVPSAPATAVPSAPVTPPQEEKDKIYGPRVLPEGPPVGTIIKLPAAKKKAEGEAVVGGPGRLAPKEEVAPPTVEEEEADKKLKLKKVAKKSKFEEDELGIEGIGRVGSISQIARLTGHTTADRVFQPIRTGKRRKSKIKLQGKKTEATLPKAIKRVVKMADTIAVSDLAQQLGVKGSEIIKKLMELGTMATLNQSVDFDTATLLAHDYHWEVKKTSFEEATYLQTAEDKPEQLVSRAPVVTVMGHVDHGKTSLLDAIRSTQVAAGEHGGITQHIGAYRVKLGEGKEITFLDTPGHEAFTSMRARGAKVTDIVILVVAADDGVMPQTIEAIHHAQAANVPILVAVNKIDKPDAKPDNVKRQLSEHGLQAEDWGGQTLFAHVSAKTKKGIAELLELIFLQAELLELKANPNKLAKGVIVEASLDKGRGPVATALIQEGTLRIGDMVVGGNHFGRVRAMVNDRGENVLEAGPGFPVEILGLDGVPQASEPIQALKEEAMAREIVDHRLVKTRDQRMMADSKMSLEELFTKMKAGEAKELQLIIKADVQGSSEAVRESLKKLSTPAVQVRILHEGVGGITESDVMLASASNGVIIGFNVRPDNQARELAEREGVEIKVYPAEAGSAK